MTTLGEKLRAALDAKGSDVVKKTIEAWDNHEDQIRKPQQEKQMEQQPQYNFKVGNNVMRETFNLVKRNPNLPAKQYIEMLVATGFKKGSVTSVLYQLIRVGQITKSTYGGLHTAQDEYTPIKQIKKKKQEPVVEAKPARKIVLIKRRKSDDTTQGIAALKADTVVKADGGPFEFLKAKAFHPSAIVDNLSVLHARELYDYLKKIFTGEIK